MMIMMATIINLVLGLLGIASVFGLILFPILTIIFGVVEGTKELPAGQTRSFKKTIIAAIGFAICMALTVITLALYAVVGFALRS